MIHVEDGKYHITGDREKLAGDFATVVRGIIEHGTYGEPGDTIEGLSKMIERMSTALAVEIENAKKKRGEKPPDDEIWEFRLPPEWF